MPQAGLPTEERQWSAAKARCYGSTQSRAHGRTAAAGLTRSESAIPITTCCSIAMNATEGTADASFHKSLGPQGVGSSGIYALMDCGACPNDAEDSEPG